MYTLNYNANYSSGTLIEMQLKLSNEPLNKKLQDTLINTFIKVSKNENEGEQK